MWQAKSTLPPPTISMLTLNGRHLEAEDHTSAVFTYKQEEGPYMMIRAWLR